MNVAKHSLLLSLILSGCDNTPPAVDAAPPPALPDAGLGWRIVADLAAEGNRDLDVLFVIDNSGGIGEEQALLTAVFPQFVDALASAPGGLPNLHLGVVSADVGAGGQPVVACDGDGDDGLLQSQPWNDCEPPMGRFIRDIANADGTRAANYAGTLADAFGCIARLGTSGCGFEQPLESMKRALEGSNPENLGFARPNAYLAVVFISTEDDCSAFDPAIFDPTQDGLTDPLGPFSSFRCAEFGIECDGDPISRFPKEYSPPGVCVPRTDSPYLRHPQDYVDFLRSTRDDPNLFIVAGILGDPVPVRVAVDPVDQAPDVVPSCLTIGLGEGWPSVRLSWFLAQFPSRNLLSTICRTDFAEPLVDIAELVAEAVGSLCITGPVSDDPATPWLDCSVADSIDGQLSALVECATTGGAPPCYDLVADPASCPATETHLEVRVRRLAAPPAGTRVIVSCLAPPP